MKRLRERERERATHTQRHTRETNGGRGRVAGGAKMDAVRESGAGERVEGAGGGSAGRGDQELRGYGKRQVGEGSEFLSPARSDADGSTVSREVAEGIAA